jgi:hypothetical protein
MARCALIDIKTNTQVNAIVAEVTDPVPDGYKLVEILPGYYWNEFAGQLMLQNQYWDGFQIQTKSEKVNINCLKNYEPTTNISNMTKLRYMVWIVI